MTEQQLKIDIINSSYEASACHIGSALSCAGILIDLFYQEGIKPEQFLFGKASGVCAYYCILADLGYFPKADVATTLKHYPLPSHEVSGVLHSFGSVGHALSVAAGMALGDRETEYYVLLSDGDLQEGSTYEAALFIRQHNLTNLHVYVDNNKIQACGITEEILSLTTAFEFYEKTIPNFYNVETVKGEGVDFMENDFEWHYKNLDENLRDKALEQL